MNAWKRQVIALIYLEQFTASLLKEMPKSKKLTNIKRRIKRWLDRCWEPVLKGKSHIDVNKGFKIAGAAMASIFKHIKKLYEEQRLHNGGAIASFLVVAEDFIFQLPKKDQRRYCWGYLASAYNDLYEMIDPDWTNNELQEQGIRLAEMVEKEAK